jgi:hypothetical protein
VVVFIVDNDSRKRVAKNFRHFFFSNSIFLFFPRAALAGAEFFFLKCFSKILQRFHQATQQQQPATSSSQQQREIIQVYVYMYTQIFGKKRVLTL